MASEESYPALISLAVHELRTPANIVWGYLKMLTRDGQSTLGANERHLVEQAEKSCARLAELVAELSDVANLDAGQAPMARRRVDLFGLVGEAAAGSHEGEDRGVRVDVRGQSAGASVEGDPDRLRPALAAHPIVAVSSPPYDRCGSTTNDHGRHEYRRHRGQRARVRRLMGSAAFNDKRGGFGLALPIARRVIEAHGGRRGRALTAVSISFPWLLNVAPAAASFNLPGKHARARAFALVSAHPHGTQQLFRPDRPRRGQHRSTGRGSPGIGVTKEELRRLADPGRPLSRRPSAIRCTSSWRTVRSSMPARAARRAVAGGLALTTAPDVNHG
jgi:hypothetical protein